MAESTTGGEEQSQAMGLQFNSAQDVGQNQSNIPMTPLRESQEIMVGTTGRAILLGDENAVDSDNVDNPSAPPYHTSKGGILPNWLQSSSPKTKALLSLIATLLLAFVAVLIVGVLQLPSSAGRNEGANGMQSDENVAGVSEISAQPQTAPTPKPSPATTEAAATDAPALGFVSIPISESDVNVLLPTYLEMKLPDLTDELSTNDEQNWLIVEGRLESTISTSLSESLPENYLVDSIQVDKFDGHVTSSLRKRKKRTGTRNLQNDSSKTIHAVVYSSSVTVWCLESDCTMAADTVARATSNLSKREYLQVTAETEAPIASANITSAPVIIPSISTPAPMIPQSTTASPTMRPSPSPVTDKPTSTAPVTDVPTGPVGSVLLPLKDRDEECVEDEPCERCSGSCSDHGGCQAGLLCFQRRGYELIPGCEGPGRPGRSYCYDPFVDGLTTEELLSNKDDKDENCDKKDRCDKCRGDCDEDEDCEKNLLCFKRSDFRPVPGCAGQGTSGTDYCFDPNDIDGEY